MVKGWRRKRGPVAAPKYSGALRWPRRTKYSGDGSVPVRCLACVPKGPNLVVYRTKSDDVRDHFVIPYSVVRDLLVEGTMTTSEVNGSKRWNLTLKNGGLHVSHRAGMIDVSKYHGARLLVERAAIGEGAAMGGASDEVAVDGTLADHVRTPVARVAVGPGNEVPDVHPTAGAGFGRSEEDRKVEEAAVNLVSDTYRQEGWHVVSVEQRRCGFDLRCFRDGQEAHVEVKGVAGSDRRFVITEGELRCAEKDDQFVLALVTSALSSQPVLERLPAARFRSGFTFAAIQYWASPTQQDGRVAEEPNEAARDRGLGATPAKPVASRHGRSGGTRSTAVKR